MRIVKAKLCFLLSLVIALSVGVARSQQATTATVIFLFPTKLAMRHSPIYIDGTDVVDLKPNHYVELKVAPGLHSFAGKTKEQGDQLDAQAGGTYYFRLHTAYWEGFILEPIPEGVAQYDLKYLKLQPAKK